RRIFCRLFDGQMRELLPASQSLVFPEFTIACPAIGQARFVALSLNADDFVPPSDMHRIQFVDKDLSLCQSMLSYAFDVAGYCG
ncbi:hypothetical protein GCK32_022002, partial [Trichostrongylus colubriformis]